MSGPAKAGRPETRLELFDAYTLGDTFTEEEKVRLLAFIMQLNAAIQPHIRACQIYSQNRGIFEGAAPEGGTGLFCAKAVGKRQNACAYFGVLEVDTRYTGRRDYAIELPSLTVSDKVSLKIILCGFENRSDPALAASGIFNAAMLNHTCTEANINTIFELVPVMLYANPDARRKVKEMDAEYRRINSDLADQASEVLFKYYIVVAHTVAPIPASGQLLVSYNQPVRGAIDHRSNYFMPEDMAKRVCKRDEVLRPCMCETGGCPFKRFFVLHRDLA